MTQEDQSTCVDSWVHRLPENGHQPLGRDNSLWRSACPILWSNPIVKRYFLELAPCVLPCPTTQEDQSTCVDSWVHGVPEMDISHWDAAIHYGVQLAQYCDQTRSFNAISWRLPPVYSLALRLRNTKVPVWTHESMGYPKMDISHWDAAIHYGVQLAQYCDQTLCCNAISPRSPPLCYLAIRLRRPKYLCGLLSPWGTRKWTSAIGTRQFTMAFSLPNIVIKPYVATLFHRDRPLCAALPWDPGRPKYLRGLMSP